MKQISALEFSEWIREYNTAGLCPTSRPTEHAENCVNTCNVIICSELPRSIESAKAFDKKCTLLHDSIFNEAGLPFADWHTIKLSPKTWAVFFRILWLLGYARNSESFKEAKIRASEAVEKLTEIACKYESVLFVGHGVYNRILANELRRRGWAGPKNPGSKHWAFGVYER
ncbi:MAG: histidine phosphatase family protein [Candidatus Thiodiazotropha sp. L084R]